jgi:hypothetical protein
MDLQQAFNVLEHKFEDGVGTVVGTGIRREEWLPIRAALIEALKPAYNSQRDEITLLTCGKCTGEFLVPVSFIHHRCVLQNCDGILHDLGA